MRKRILVSIAIILIANLTAKSLNNEKKTLEVGKVSESPNIDGIINESVWEDAAVAKDFFQFEPYNGKAPSLPTEVKVIYDDKAIYFAVKLLDSEPDSILRDLSNRDSFDGANADLFAVVISTFNDGINAVNFMVSAAGVQSDAKMNGNHDDSNWDAVWESAVNITDNGWIAEMKIPYSALRFSKEKSQTWGIHFFRNIRRYREWSTWNFVDINTRGFVNQMGELTGIKNIEPPLRLSVSPYVSSYIENDADANKWGNNYNVGMDLKWGINQSFTMDMILIPDFGQVQSDDEVLNLSPYEIRYDEKRSFFTEGTELFNKGKVFYSRRIGSTPKNKYDVDENLDSNEVVIENPIETKLINATKVSGRTENGLGVGFFNAMTGPADAIIKDTIPKIRINGNDTSYYYEKRKFRTQGFTNYNMLVFDQTLKNNSYVSFVNTNVLHAEEKYTANVTGGEFRLMNKENSYQVFGRGSISQKYTDSTEFGHTYYLMLAKTKGNFLFEIAHNTESDTYDPNDMGYIRQNNRSIWYSEFNYNINEPFWKVLNWRNEINFRYQNLYKPRKFSQFEVSMITNTTFAKSYIHTGLFMNFKPFEGNDYNEPRVDGWKFNRPRSGVYNWWISTDYRKRFAVDFNTGAWKAFDYDRYGYWFGIGPRIRFNDKWLLRYRLTMDMNYNTYGHIDHYEDDDSNTIINFGKRDQSTIINTVNTNYIFNNKMSLSFRVRHYWSRVEYDDFYTLQEDGSLSSSIGKDAYNVNTNYNAFTIDMKYLWRFAPGSEMAFVWKNAIYTYESDIINNFMENLDNTIFDSSPINSFSLKILYYLDYQYLAKNK